MLIYGKNVLKDIDKKRIKKAYCARKEYTDILKNNKIHYEYTDMKRLDKMVDGNHQGIVIDIFDYEYKTINDIKGDFILVLDHLQDPHNFGAIIRTCACAGIKSIIIPKDRSVKVTDVVIKTSAGTIDKVDIIMVSNLVNTIETLKKQNYFIYSSCMDGESYQTIDTSGKKVLVIGSEGEGVSNIVKKSSDYLISIPMENKIDSLNASVAAGILIYNMKG